MNLELRSFEELDSEGRSRVGGAGASLETNCVTLVITEAGVTSRWSVNRRVKIMHVQSFSMAVYSLQLITL